MGDYYQTIVDLDASAEEAEPLANRIRDWLVEQRIILPEKQIDSAFGEYLPGSRFDLALEEKPVRGISDGLIIKTGRTVFYVVGWEYTCRKCGALFEPDQDKPESGEGNFIKAVDAWYAGDATASVPCPTCGQVELLTEWDGPFPWAFGYLGFEFWNWPALSPRFILEMTTRLGHRTRLVRGKL